MKFSAKLKAALAPKEATFTAGDKNYFNDPRWELAKAYAEQLRFSECQRVVADIDQSFGYGR